MFRNSNRNHRAATGVAASVALSSLMLGLAQPAHADSAYPTLAVANARSAPSTTAPIVNVIPQGFAVAIRCVTRGQSVNGTDLWDYVPGSGWVSDSLIRTGSDDPVARDCADMSGYDRTASVDWALAHVDSGYRFRDDCTWYVSQALLAGGLAPTHDWTASTNDWFDLADKWGGPGGPSRAAANADYFKNAIRSAGYGTLSELTIGDPSAGGAEPGDVILFDWNGGADGTIDHAALVTSVRSDGTVIISQHSPSRAARVWDEYEDHTKLHDLRAYLLHIDR